MKYSESKNFEEYRTFSLLLKDQYLLNKLKTLKFIKMPHAATIRMYMSLVLTYLHLLWYFIIKLNQVSLVCLYLNIHMYILQFYKYGD